MTATDLAWPVAAALAVAPAAPLWPAGARAQQWLPTLGGGRVLAGRVWCVGRNFADHAREMGGDPQREAPFFFAKPTDALCWRPRLLPLPPASDDVQHEVELAIVLGAGGRDLAVEAAERAIGWSAVAVDLTRRDLQAAAKASGRPWAMAKGFDASAPIGTLARWPGWAAMAQAELALAVDGRQRQRAALAAMTWSPAEIVAELSRLVEVRPGDVVLCGTPAGVGRLDAGARVAATLAGLPPLAWTVGAVGDAARGATTPDEVLALWFGPGDKMERWFGRSQVFDDEVRAAFGADVVAAQRGELDGWAQTPVGRLALVVLLDQLSRHVFRGQGGAFAGDARARVHALAAIDGGDDRLLPREARPFLYLPLEHAEDLALQDRSCTLFAQFAAEAPAAERAGAAVMLDFAERHRDVIARYGRFPHRNAALGRVSTDDELAYLATPGAGF